MFHHAARRAVVTTSNVSPSGAFFLATSSLPVGTLLMLESSESEYNTHGLRLLAKVAHSRRGFPVRGKDAGMGVRWVRAFCSGGRETLSRFLREVLGFGEEDLARVSENETGDAIYDFPSLSLTGQEPRPVATRVRTEQQPTPRRIEVGHRKLRAIQRGRFSVYAPVVFSIDNMHYQGRATSIGPEGLTVETAAGLPSQFCRVAVRYPLCTGRLGERVVLYGEVDIVVAGNPGEPGVFNVTLTGLDELDNPGAFRSFLHGLAKEHKQS